MIVFPILRRNVVVLGILCLLHGCAQEDPRIPVQGEGGQSAGGSGGNTGGAGGDGGTGGEGGVGGQGGDGGSGGGGSGGEAGGPPPRCGDGTLDEGEDCDLGTKNGTVSACSFECRWQGTCDEPIDWAEVATPGTGDFIDIPETTFTGHADLTPPGSCNTPGEQLVFRYVPPVGGVLFVGFQNAIVEPKGNPVLIVRTSCADPSTELPGLCVPHRGGIVSKVEVEGGVPLYFVVDSHEAAIPNWWFSIGTALFPFKGVGEICAGLGVDPDRNRCGPGLACGPDDVCIPSTPPVLLDATVFRGGLRGDELVVSVEATDESSDLQGIEGRFFDDAGTLLEPEPGGGDPHPVWMATSLRGSAASADDFLRTVDFFAFWPGLRSATEVEVVVRDRGGNRSEPLRRPILPLPVAPEGEACDPEELLVRCAEGTRCGESGFCEALAPQRQLLCDDAPTIGLGEELSFSENLALGQPPSLPPVWRVHESCPLENWSDYYRLNPSTQIARLHLPSPATDVRISVEGNAVTRPVLMLYSGCGLVDPPLHCAHPDQIFSRSAALHFESLDAGNYLIVVKPNEVRLSTAWTLRVEGSL